VAIVGRRPPAVLSDGDRVFVWAGGVAHVVTDAGHVAYGRDVRRASCPVLVPGTSSLVSMSFGSYTAQEVTTGDVTARIPIGAGWEAWSPSRRTLALFDSDARRLNVVDFRDGARPSGWFAVAGLAGIAWSVADEDLLLVRTTADGIEVDRFEVRTGELTSAIAVIPPSQGSPLGASNVALWSPDGLTVMLSDGTLLDVPSGQVTSLGTGWAPGERASDSTVIAVADPEGSIAILDRDGRTVVSAGLGIAGGSLAWSPSGRDLAFRDAAGLTVVARDGTRRRSLVLDRTASFAWASDDALLVAETVAPGSISLTRYAAADLSAIAQTTSASSLADTVIPDPSRVCLQFDPAGPVGS
jgi:hypothetical protein